MKNVLKISAVLSWINLVVWSIFVIICLLAGLLYQLFPLVIVAFLLSVIVLHSYAALQLRKSLRNPSIPLSRQTPTGIRFIGFIASFFGMISILDGIACFQNTKEIVDLIRPQFEEAYKGLNFNLVTYVHTMGVISLLLGLAVSINVFLNFRLLRWWFFVQDSQPKP
jgi:hypothetical protein